ncbi:MAG: domain S-box protein, partial [Rhizobacter sp.]|nr:domain S-box protein [Rhizobacter sp.]
MPLDRVFDDTGFLRGLFEQAPGFMAVVRGPRHVFELANSAFVRTVGNRQVVGLPVAEAMPEVATQGFIALLDQVLSSGEPYVGTNVRLNLQMWADRLEERVIDFVYQPIRDAAGRVEGIFIEGVDVTERSLAAERLRIAQEAGGIGTFEWFPDTGEVIGSDEYRRIWGLPPDNEPISDEQLVRLVLPEDRPTTGPVRVAQHGNPLEYAEYRVRRPSDGQVRWLARRGEVLDGAQGLGRRYLGVAFDITQRKETEHEMLALNDRLRALFEQTAVGVLQAGVDGRIAVVNDRYCEMLGRSR